MKIKTQPKASASKARRSVKSTLPTVHIIFNWVLLAGFLIIMFFSNQNSYMKVGEKDIASQSNWIFPAWAAVVIAIVLVVSVIVQQFISEGFIYDLVGPMVIPVVPLVLALLTAGVSLVGMHLLSPDSELSDRIKASVIIEADDTDEQIVEALKENIRGIKDGNKTLVYNKQQDLTGKYSSYYQYVGITEEVLADMTASK